MDTPAFATVRTARTLMEADVIMTALRSAGLNPVEQGMAGHFSLAGSDIEYPVHVPTEELDAAREVLQAHALNDAGA